MNDLHYMNSRLACTQFDITETEDYRLDNNSLVKNACTFSKMFSQQYWCTNFSFDATMNTIEKAL